MTGFGHEYDKGADWSYGWYFRTQGWLLIGMIVLPPIIFYGFIRAILLVLKWVWGRASET
jgi:hypothetical protein